MIFVDHWTTNETTKHAFYYTNIPRIGNYMNTQTTYTATHSSHLNIRIRAAETAHYKAERCRTP